MKLINPNVEIWTQGDTIEDMWKHIARCTLVCRQAESIKDDETAEEFCKRTILARKPLNNPGNHLAMLEHGTVYLTCPSVLYVNKLGKYAKYNYDEENHQYCITTNLRVLVEQDCLCLLNEIVQPTKHHPKRITVCFTTNIGVSREFNRHRVNSIAEESTRYCNYSKDKFDNQVKFALPAWLLTEDNLSYVESCKFYKLDSYIDDIYNMLDKELLNEWCDIDFYLAALTFAEWSYNMLIAKGWTAQQAREVLPLATKTQLIHTAYIDDWKHFLDLRYKGISGAPHPNAKLIAEKLYNKML